MSGEHVPFQLRFGALVENAGVRFRVWAPRAKTLDIRIIGSTDATIPMVRGDDDVFEGFVDGIGAGTDYRYVINGDHERPDPVSRLQPYGVHGPSQVVAPAGASTKAPQFQCVSRADLVLYELHVGTFTPQGTFDGVIGKLEYLRKLGINAIELMPVAEFPGEHNWGYDGVHLYAPHTAYGGPDGLKRLVAACHAAQIAVILDVVYNHLGPEGNYLAEYGPYFTDRHHTPWGSALNFDGPDSAHVRRYFLDNALYWLNEFQIDGLRLDAIHGIFDLGTRHILEELATTVQIDARATGRNVVLIAESDLNDPRVIAPVENGGYGHDAQWSDDFHHALHTRLTGTRHGYFADFGDLAAVEKALTHGFVYDGGYSAFRQRNHGASSLEYPGDQFVVYTQNHDQIANGSGGKRHARLLTLPAQKLAAFLLFAVAPNVPMFFMGQEYGETAPFLYFTSFGDEALAHAVSEGRKAEFAGFGWEHEHEDPQAMSTFDHSKLDWAKLEHSPHAEIWQLHHDLLQLRAKHPWLRNGRKDLLRVERSDVDGYMVVHRDDPTNGSALALLNFTNEGKSLPILSAIGPAWQRALYTDDVRYGGSSKDAPPTHLDYDNGAPPRLFCPPFAAILYLSSEQPQ